MFDRKLMRNSFENQLNQFSSRKSQILLGSEFSVARIFLFLSFVPLEDLIFWGFGTEQDPTGAHLVTDQMMNHLLRG